MTVPTSAPQGGGLAGPDLRRVTGTLCATEIVSWGAMYYALPVLAGPITSDTGWSTAAIMAAFTAAQLVAALAGLAVGRHIDRFGPRTLMSIGSAAAVVALLVLAWSDSFGWFVGAWVLAGCAMSAVLYAPAFAALNGWSAARHRVRALTAVTLVAGLASTIFAPLTSALSGLLGWRGTYVVLAGIVALTIPAHWWGLKPPWSASIAAPRRTRQPVWRTGQFLALAIALSATALCAYAAVVNLVPMLTARGVSLGAAAVVLGLGGVGQVCGRLAFAPLRNRLSLPTTTLAMLLLVAVTTAALTSTANLTVLAVLALLAGSVRGGTTLLQATAVVDRWGVANVGGLSATLAAPIMITTAAAPWAGAQLAQMMGGYVPAFLCLAGVAAASAALVPLTFPTTPEGP